MIDNRPPQMGTCVSLRHTTGPHIFTRKCVDWQPVAPEKEARTLARKFDTLCPEEKAAIQGAASAVALQPRPEKCPTCDSQVRDERNCLVPEHPHPYADHDYCKHIWHDASFAAAPAVAAQVKEDLDVMTRKEAGAMNSYVAAAKLCVEKEKEIVRLKFLLKKCEPDVVGNLSRMKRELVNAKGVLATSALKDAIKNAERNIVEIEEAK